MNSRFALPLATISMAIIAAFFLWALFKGI